MSEHEEAPAKLVIGLTFGNSYSSIAWIKPDGKPEVIANQEGGQTTQ